MTTPAFSEYEAKVQQVMTVTSCSREKAEMAVNINFPTLAPPAPKDSERNAAVLEGKEQHEIYKLFRGYGFKVMNLSQARASKQSPGLGDAWVMHKTRPIAFWWESKRQVGGEYSEAQIEMRNDCHRCGIKYYGGDRYAAAKLLVALGVAVPGVGQYNIVPAPNHP